MKNEKFIKVSTIVLKTLALVLMGIYLAQMYTTYLIDEKQVLPADWTFIIIFLRWATIVAVGFGIIVPWFGCKHPKIIFSILGPVVGVLNLVLLKQNMIAWGPETATTWRMSLFIVEQVFLILLGLYYFVENFVTKNWKHIKPVVLILVLVGMFLTFVYQPICTILFGDVEEPAQDFNEYHVIYLALTATALIFFYFFMRNKPMQSKRFFFAAMSCSSVLNYFYVGFSYGQIPFHLCNAAVVLLFLSFVFNIKPIFYFTYFVNVVGTLFAMLMPNVGDPAFAFGSVRFWYNHIYAFIVPILGVALHVFDRPKMKSMWGAIIAFTGYFLVVAVINAWFSNFADVDFFFINSHFYIDKAVSIGLVKDTSIMDNHVWDLTHAQLSIIPEGYTFRFYPIYHFIVYAVFIALMFLIWFIYDAVYKISDSHYALRMKKKLIKQGFEDLKKQLNGRKLNEPLFEEKKNMIEIKHFTKVYSGSNAPSVKDLNLTINDGEVYGFLGHNGAGKSTTIKSLVGIQSITSGQMIVDGFDVAKQPVEAKLRIGYVSDNHAVYEKLTGREYINYIADLYMVNQEDRDARIDKYVKMFKLEDAIDREIKSYSHGMKQKIVVISSLIHDPKVWILDEPLTGLDPTSAYQIKECMREHAAKGNIVFFSSHVIEVVEKICTRICIIGHGELKCEYSLKELKEKGISLEELYLKYVTNADKE